MSLYVEMIQTKSWWDTVDGVNSMLIMPYFINRPDDLDELSFAWAKAENIWLKRTSIICQLKLRKDTQVDILFRNIKLNLNSKEFFVQKAIGWVLREFSTEPQLVSHFVKNNKMAKFSDREAMRIILKSEV